MIKIMRHSDLILFSCLKVENSKLEQHSILQDNKTTLLNNNILSLSLSLSLFLSLSLSLCFSLPPVLSLVESLLTPEHHHVTTLAPLMRGFCFQCIQLCTFATNIHTRLSFSRLLQLKNQMSLASSIVLVISSSQFFPILRICYLTVFAKNIIIKQCNEQLNYFPPNCVLQALD